MSADGAVIAMAGPAAIPRRNGEIAFDEEPGADYWERWLAALEALVAAQDS